MVKLMLSCLVIASIDASCQNADHLSSLIKAEKSFAKHSVEQDTRSAFLANLASDGIVFQAGKPVNGIEYWNSQATPRYYLSWYPVFADISQSNDLGYTTGPFEFKNDRNDTTAAFGYYSTIWRKGEDGVWRVLVDLGISTPGRSKAMSTPMDERSKETGFNATGNRNSIDFIVANEWLYNNSLSALGRSFDPSHLSERAKVHRPREFPYWGKDFYSRIDESDKKFEFLFVDGGISMAADMAYTYGEVAVELTTNGNVRMVQAGYIRIWKKEGSEWKIVLDVIGT